MSDVDWGSEGKELPKPKKRVPLWLWICGGGCLLAIIAAVALAIFVFSKASRMMNQDEQWAELAKVLPFDEKPQNVMIMGTGEFASIAPGVDDMWQIQGRAALWQVQIFKFSGGLAAEQRKRIASGELGDEQRKKIGPFGLFELEHGTVEIQGRSVPWIRCQTFEKTADEEKDADPAAGADKDKDIGAFDTMKLAMTQRVMILDITPEGGSGELELRYVELGKGDPVDPGRVVEFLLPFQVGPKHETK